MFLIVQVTSIRCSLMFISWCFPHISCEHLDNSYSYSNYCLKVKAFIFYSRIKTEQDKTTLSISRKSLLISHGWIKNLSNCSLQIYLSAVIFSSNFLHHAMLVDSYYLYNFDDNVFIFLELQLYRSELNNKWCLLKHRLLD